jgi:hypothetical protein
MSWLREQYQQEKHIIVGIESASKRVLDRGRNVFAFRIQRLPDAYSLIGISSGM